MACELLATERVELKILNSPRMDLDLASRPFVPDFSKLELIAQQILSTGQLESSGRETRTRGDLVEVV